MRLCRKKVKEKQVPPKPYRAWSSIISSGKRILPWLSKWWLYLMILLMFSYGRRENRSRISWRPSIPDNRSDNEKWCAKDLAAWVWPYGSSSACEFNSNLVSQFYLVNTSLTDCSSSANENGFGMNLNPRFWMTAIGISYPCNRCWGWLLIRAFSGAIDPRVLRTGH